MKLLAFAILAVTAVAAAVLLALNRPGAEASPDVTITVNSTADTNTRNAELTLREAMMLATGALSVDALAEGECNQVSDATWENGMFWACGSAHPPGAASADTIVFDPAVFPQGSPATISLGSALHALDTGGDTVDGAATGVVVDGEGKSIDCFEITSEYNTIKGLEIYGCVSGVWIHGGAQGNTIGGSTDAERNVISGHSLNGITINGSGTDDNVVKGNYIGIDPLSIALPNGQHGVYIEDGAKGNTIENNVISGNGEDGVHVSGGGTDGNVLKGNKIGTNALGNAAISNDRYGVIITGGPKNNTVEGNVISGNKAQGLDIRNPGTDGNVVRDNFIGTDALGTAPIANYLSGVSIGYFVKNNVIQDNVISGNGQNGVYIWEADSTTIKGNHIGTDASGTSAVPNANHGVYIIGSLGFGPTGGNTIGSTGAGEGNTIAFNGGDGVRVDGGAAVGNITRGNSIHSNGGKGIENIDGGNTELTRPTITGFGSVMGTACSNCTIDVYSDQADEGEVYEGSTAVDPAGNWTFTGTPQGPNVTATATDASGNTSEFSAPVAVPEPTPTPTPSPTPSLTPEATRTLDWGPGWHNATWSGASAPEETFACAAGNYAAAYRLVGGGWERYFPDRPELSNMTDLGQYDAFLILVTGDVTCEMEVAEPLGTERTLDWGVGWQNDGWSGADGTEPQDAFACADGNYAAAYRLVGGGWERYFPDRPDISNMGSLDKYDAFLILVTAPVSCTMAIAS